MSDPVRARSNGRRRKEARPSELAEAALGLFVEKGYAATRLDEVAARAGVSKGTLYLYFDSKESLFKAVITMGIDPVMARGESMFEELRDDPVALLRALLAGWWELVGATELAGIPKLMIAEARNFPELARFYHEEVISRGRALVAGALELGIERGLIRRVDVPSAVQVLMAPLLMLSVWRTSFAVCDADACRPEKYLPTYFDLILNGLLVRPGAGELP
ncbi:MAG: TetR/AcrR family transcriptional regulator [Zoogloeaceae bacterium]|nr:TetR/AcrR family transcriptional regulator [Rhodocyclaceae bacterium]MCP5237909.1 TetR/AcrR family transcriptional regulator [Zoogloeaceae bacterium]